MTFYSSDVRDGSLIVVGMDMMLGMLGHHSLTSYLIEFIHNKGYFSLQQYNIEQDNPTTEQRWITIEELGLERGFVVNGRNTS